jgi:segregation and condensation protein B
MKLGMNEADVVTGGQESELGEPPIAGPEAGAAAAPDTSWIDEKLKAILESLLFAAGEPVTLAQLAHALEQVPRERIRKTLSEMAAEYVSCGRGLVLDEIAGGYQLRTVSEHAVYVRRLLSAKPPRLSRPVLETLAIIAYRQPITRPEIEQLRGVDTGGVLDTLMDRDLIKIAGRKEAPGRPMMYTTTPAFLELFGLKDLESLPDLEEFRELEGLRENTEAAQQAPSPDSDAIETPQSASAFGSREQGIESESAGNPTNPQIDAIARQSSSAATTPGENAGSPAEGSESETRPSSFDDKDAV